jgi:hypothetical protein
MANKSVLIAMLLLLCITAVIEAKTYKRKSLGSGSLNANGRRMWGRSSYTRRNFYYYVPRGAVHVSLHYSDYSSSGLTIRKSRCGARLYWTPGSRTAIVRAWTRPSDWFSRTRIAWTVWVWF